MTKNQKLKLLCDDVVQSSFLSVAGAFIWPVGSRTTRNESTTSIARDIFRGCLEVLFSPYFRTIREVFIGD
jgi:hypothetical protein